MSRHFPFWLQTNRKTLNGKLRQIIYHYERNMKSIQQISNRNKKGEDTQFNQPVFVESYRMLLLFWSDLFHFGKMRSLDFSLDVEYDAPY